MIRSLLATVLLLGTGLAVAPPAAAQATRAYAPENLRSLSTQDRVRVIENEYSDQSRGRQIPDDQLEFYLDQVDSGWGFSRIKQDIATSLGRNQGNWRPQPGYQTQVVSCSSNDNKRRECPVPFRGNARLVENLSGTRCVEGQNWGQGRGTVWVDRGCRGRFAIAPGNGGVVGPGPIAGTVRCESTDNRERLCPANFRGRARLSRQISDTRCVENQTWGQRGSAIWVSRGCRGEFIDGGGSGGNWGGGNGNPNYSVTCGSSDNRRSTCAWDRSAGQPRVLQQLSKSQCQENYSWGYQGDAIWVDRGCRARFGVR